MRFEVTIEELEEYACCIVDCNLTRDEACDYIKSCVTGSDSFDPDENKAIPINDHPLKDEVFEKLRSGEIILS